LINFYNCLYINTLEQSEKTKKFITHVNNLIDSGEIKNYAAIIKALNWDKTMFSSVMNGRKNVPNDIFKKFTEVYQLPVNNSITTDALSAMVRGLRHIVVEQQAKIFGVSYSETGLKLIRKFTNV